MCFRYIAYVRRNVYLSERIHVIAVKEKRDYTERKERNRRKSGNKKKKKEKSEEI